MNARALAFAAALASSPLLAGGDASAPSSSTPTFADAWRALPSTTNGCSERELHFDYWPSGGIRNFWCHARTAMTWKAFVALAPHKPFVRGPHMKGASNELALQDPRDFGRYNPKFVKWLVDNAVPAAKDEKLRAETQPVYDAHVRELARTYWAVHKHIEARPAWKKQARVEYLRVMDEKNPDWGAYYDKFATTLGEADSNWGGYDPNLQSASVAWWLRRDIDKSAPLFAEGLEKLLRTYDAAWLDSVARPAPGKKPH